MRRALLLLVLVGATAVAEQKCGQVKVNPVVASMVSVSNQTGNAIIGGTQAAEGAWPWTVSICILDWFGGCQFRAAGAIISDRWVVTAYSAVDPVYATKYRVRAGSSSNIYGGQFVQVKSIVNPRDANTDNHHADLALVELDTPLQFTDFVQPICLPSSDDDALQPFTLDWFAGWGMTSASAPAQETYLQQTQMRVTDGFGCPKYYDKEVQICGGGGNGGNACSFDAGGPLMQQTGGVWYLYGVAVNTDYASSGCTRPAVLTRVTAYCDYIKQTSGVSCQ